MLLTSTQPVDMDRSTPVYIVENDEGRPFKRSAESKKKKKKREHTLTKLNTVHALFPTHSVKSRNQFLCLGDA